ncbi:hypothetical protein FRACA_2410006 [Frankia canadensis]|uniref:Uncharacterized protein n=1 Tax=Frankia canadensis TaxID=1836972 RepID=A0A2I2KRU5_9ACTN|nr:hypothetical protein FRACA_2410006 [Frankia canadensis]SOU55659.1 hypothetical protein FRACA_2410006 [Frankia canadensis]
MLGGVDAHRRRRVPAERLDDRAGQGGAVPPAGGRVAGEQLGVGGQERPRPDRLVRGATPGLINRICLERAHRDASQRIDMRRPSFPFGGRGSGTSRAARHIPYYRTLIDVGWFTPPTHVRCLQAQAR